VGLLDRLMGRPAADSAVADASARGRGALIGAAAVVAPLEAKKLAKGSRSRGWQKASFEYRRALPEVGYALRFLGNNSRHIRLFVGDRPRGADEVLELNDAYAEIAGPDALPADLIEAAQEALYRLTGNAPSGGGSSILAPIVQAFEGPGECWLVGRYFPEEDRETWAVHSISEVQPQDGKHPLAGDDAPKGYYRLVTGEGRDAEKVDLDPATTTVIRLWSADPEFSAEPDSPMRTLAGTCERLLLVERATDAVLRSRAAGNGVFILPEEIEFGDDEDNEELTDDAFQRDFTTQLVTPLSQDGSAASVVPMVLRGPHQYLDRIRHLTIERALDPKLAELEARLLTRLGIGLDVPPEVITGYADVNHWNVWQISADTFKNHQEPVTIAGCEATTIGYLRHRLALLNRWDAELIDRLVIWYDPASLITPPDRRQAANDAHDRKAISDAAYLEALGFDSSDAPPEELVSGAQPVGSTGMLPDVLEQVSNIAGTLLRAGFEPAAVSAALGLTIEHTGMVPVTVKPAEELEQAAQPALPPAAPPAEEPPAEEPEEPAAQVASALARLTGAPVVVASERLALVAAAPPSDEQRRLSRRLTEIDRRLRERLAVAADSALARALERAGNRLRSAARSNPQAAELAAGQPAHLLASALGRGMVAALGSDEAELLADAFARLRTQYVDWSSGAAEEAIDTAARLSGLPRDHPTVVRMVAELRDAFAESIEASWPALEQSLTDLAAERLYQPDPSLPDVGELPDGLVPDGLIRQALALAGGLGGAETLTGPLSALTSGELLGGFLRDSGVQPVEYEWVYGISSRTFTPHAQLDGLVFSGFDDPALRTAAFPGYEWIGDSFAPGDHAGCHCDAAVIYADGGNARDELQQIIEASYREQNPGRDLPTRQATVDGFKDQPGVVTERSSGGGTTTFRRTTDTR